MIALKEWKILLITILLILLLILKIYYDYRLESAANEKTKALAAQAIILQDKCNADKKITEDISNDYQSQINQLHANLVSLGLRQPSTCIPVLPANATTGNHGTASRGESSGQNAGVTTGALDNFAVEAETYRLRLIGCQQFVKQTWKANGQN